MTSSHAWRSALVAAMGGFLFGFDTAVISGVEKTIQSLWQLDNFWQGFTVSAALWGTVVGAAVAGPPAERWGRKKMLLAVGLLYLASAVVTALTHTWSVFILFRFLGGVGVGASSVVGPMYISEIAPAHMRGRLVALFQFNVVMGILIAFVSNYLLAGSGPAAWRWMLGVEAIPALAYLIWVFFVPESPRWLVKQKRYSEASAVLHQMGETDAPAAVDAISRSLAGAYQRVSLWQWRYRKPILLAVALALFNQLAGINAIMYYAPRIFELTGLAQDAALLQSVSIGATNMIFTLLALSMIDRLGRKPLLIIGSVGMTIALALTAYSLASETTNGLAVMFYLIAFIAFFAFSQGAVIWVFISEIFPNTVRSQGQALGSFTHWIMAAIISWLFPMVASEPTRGAWAFLFFAMMMVFQFLFAWRWMPETRGQSLEKLQDLVAD